MRLNLFHALGNDDLLQLLRTRKSICSDFGRALGNGDIAQRGTILESILTDAQLFIVIDQGNVAEHDAFCKCIARDLIQRCQCDHLGELLATIESARTDSAYVLGNLDCLEFCATAKCAKVNVLCFFIDMACGSRFRRCRKQYSVGVFLCADVISIITAFHRCTVGDIGGIVGAQMLPCMGNRCVHRVVAVELHWDCRCRSSRVVSLYNVTGKFGITCCVIPITNTAQQICISLTVAGIIRLAFTPIGVGIGCPLHKFSSICPKPDRMIGSAYVNRLSGQTHPIMPTACKALDFINNELFLGTVDRNQLCAKARCVGFCNVVRYFKRRIHVILFVRCTVLHLPRHGGSTF